MKLTFDELDLRKDAGDVPNTGIERKHLLPEAQAALDIVGSGIFSHGVETSLVVGSRFIIERRPRRDRSDYWTPEGWTGAIFEATKLTGGRASSIMEAEKASAFTEAEFLVRKA